MPEDARASTRLGSVPCPVCHAGQLHEHHSSPLPGERAVASRSSHWTGQRWVDTSPAACTNLSLLLGESHKWGLKAKPRNMVRPEAAALRLGLRTLQRPAMARGEGSGQDRDWPKTTQPWPTGQS